MAAGWRSTQPPLGDYECRVILVGKTGSGKSSLGNKLLRKKDVKPPKAKSTVVPGPGADGGFVVSPAFSSTTKECQYMTAPARIGSSDADLMVVDTPGLFDTNDDIRYTIMELTRSLSFSCPGGPHAVIFVTRCDIRFTQEEEDAFNEIIKVFGQQVTDHLILVFTHGECLDDDETIEEKLEEAKAEAPGLRRVCRAVGNRIAVFSNNKRNADEERKTLLNMIDKVSNHCHRYFTNDTLKSLSDGVNQKVHDLMKEEGISLKEALNKVRKSIGKGDESSDFYWNLIKILVVSSAFAALVGLTGGAAAVALAGVETAAAAGIGGASAATVFFTNLAYQIKDKASKTCVIS